MNIRPLELFESRNLSALNSSGQNSVLLFVTATGLEKSILDATEPVRQLLADSGVHDYRLQGQGNDHKVLKEAILLGDHSNTPSIVSLYRPCTKKGDPRLWFSGLKRFVGPNEVCAVFVYQGQIHLVNLSRTNLADALADSVQTPASRIVSEAARCANASATELLRLLRSIAAQGPLRAVCTGDTAVGRSIEAALGIDMNSNRAPDFRGIELKSGRSSIAGRDVRATLFACVPNWNLSSFKSSKEILTRFGYARGGNFQLYCTVGTKTTNSQGLRLRVDEAVEWLQEFYDRDPREEVCVWPLDELHVRLMQKHRETFWIRTEASRRGGQEYFQLKSVTHTTRPCTAQFDRLLIDGTITLDHLVKRTPSGGAHERGPLFKIERPRVPELFLGQPQVYPLT